MIIIKRPGTTTPTGAAPAPPTPPLEPSDDANEELEAAASRAPAGAPSEQPVGAPSDDGGSQRPRRDTRFQPGQSGNPKGRPKGSRSLAEEIRRAIQKRVPGTRLTFQQLMSQQLTHQGGKGSLRAIELSAKLLDQGSVNEAKQKPASEPLPLDDDAYLRIYEQLGRSLGKTDSEEPK